MTRSSASSSSLSSPSATIIFLSVIVITAFNLFQFHVSTSNKSEYYTNKRENEIDINHVRNNVNSSNKKKKNRRRAKEHQVDSLKSYADVWNELKALESELGTILGKQYNRKVLSVDQERGTLIEKSTTIDEEKEEESIGPKFQEEENDGNKNASVIGFAINYQLHIFKRFIGTLRATGYKGHIILGVDKSKLTDEILRYLASEQVLPQFINFGECTHEFKDKDWEVNTCAKLYPEFKIRWSRFFLARDWLKYCKSCTGPVLFTDVADVFFQENPFSDPKMLADNDEVQLFEEHPDQRTTHWLVDAYVSQCKNVKFDKPMLCSGSTAGTREGMLKYFNAMYEEMSEWVSHEKCRTEAIGDDQAVHNYLYYSGKLPFAKTIPHRTGIVSVVGFEGSRFRENYHKELKKRGVRKRKIDRAPYPGKDDITWIDPKFGFTDKQGYFVNLDKKKSRSRVIHQFDRYGDPLFTWVSKELMK